MIFELAMSDEDYNFIHEYTESKNISMSKFFLKSAFDRINEETLSDEDLFKISAELIEKNKSVYAELAK
ncbi:MAG: hypothetical protein IJU55_04025 [Selenomonadaceae bacterium]|nr:hypothetical protein [Selenomonadaceae bacterium]